jgi:hypothetical protein
VRVGPHEVFHLAVVAASVAFFVFVARHVIGHEHELQAAQSRSA